MCGKFTAMFSWSEVVAFSQALDSAGADDREVTYRVVGALPVITSASSASRNRARVEKR